MGLLDTLVTSAVTSALGGNANTMTGNLVKGVVGMLTSGSGGGLTGLVDKLNQSGLGDVAASWIGKGENKPISASQLVEALGEDKVAELAREAGIPEDKGAEVLSQVLPNVVNEMTPDGEVPEEHKMGTLSKIILGGLGVAGATMAAKAVAGKFGHHDDAPAMTDVAQQWTALLLLHRQPLLQLPLHRPRPIPWFPVIPYPKLPNIIMVMPMIGLRFLMPTAIN